MKFLKKFLPSLYSLSPAPKLEKLAKSAFVWCDAGIAYSARHARSDAGDVRFRSMLDQGILTVSVRNIPHPLCHLDMLLHLPKRCCGSLRLERR